MARFGYLVLQKGRWKDAQIDWQNDLVVVRWIGGGNALDGFLAKVVGAIRPAQP